MKNNLIIGVILALVAGGALGFFGGMTYQKSQKPNLAQNVMMQGNGNRQFGQGQGIRSSGPTGGGAVMGEIIDSDENSITVKLEDGSSKIVLIGANTNINKSSEGLKSDLKNGERVVAFGTTNADGSVTAQNVQIGGQMRMILRPSGVPTQQ